MAVERDKRKRKVPSGALSSDFISGEELDSFLKKNCRRRELVQPSEGGFPVKEILSHKMTAAGNLHFLVSWADGSEPTWEPEPNVGAALASAYMKKHAADFMQLPAVMKRK